MIIYTREKPINLKWVCDEMALVMLDEHDDKEMVEVCDPNGHTLFVVSFQALKKLREIRHCVDRINNSYQQRREDVEAMQLAAGGNPG